MKYEFLNLNKINSEYKSDYQNALKKLITSGSFIGGLEVKKFEDNMCSYLSTNFCIGVSNGLDALILALKAINIKDGDEVIVPTNTFIATWLAVLHVNAKIIPVEPCPKTHLINLENIKPLISKKTKAVIPVHLYGSVVDLDPINEYCKRKSIYVIEDAAQAIGASYNSRKIGSHSDLVCWSFYPGKNLGAFGDAGMVSTNNKSLAQSIRELANYGSKQKYVHDMPGFNKRLDPVQSIILDMKLKNLDRDNDLRKKLANIYIDALSFINEIENQKVLFDSVRHLFVIKTDERDNLSKFLNENSIGNLIHYPIPPHKQKAFTDFNSHSFPIAEKLSKTVLSLPIGPHLNDDDVIYISKVIKRYFKKH